MIRLVNLDKLRSQLLNYSEAKKANSKVKKGHETYKRCEYKYDYHIIIPNVIGKVRIAGSFTVTEYTGGENDQRRILI